MAEKSYNHDEGLVWEGSRNFSSLDDENLKVAITRNKKAFL
jgi:hypothetical protein